MPTSTNDMKQLLISRIPEPRRAPINVVVLYLTPSKPKANAITNTKPNDFTPKVTQLRQSIAILGLAMSASCPGCVKTHSRFFGPRFLRKI